MGLDIIAISNIKFKDLSHKDLRSSQDSIEVFKGEFNLIDGLREGIYLKSDQSETFSFRAGSYSSYNYFRKTLIKLYLNKPAFNELIYFSDCDGIIGPIVSLNLYNDFIENLEKFMSYCKEHLDNEEADSIIYTYKSFTNAFRISKDNGVVIFS